MPAAMAEVQAGARADPASPSTERGHRPGVLEIDAPATGSDFDENGADNTIEALFTTHTWSALMSTPEHTPCLRLIENFIAMSMHVILIRRRRQRFGIATFPDEATIFPVAISENVLLALSGGRDGPSASAGAAHRSARNRTPPCGR